MVALVFEKNPCARRLLQPESRGPWARRLYRRRARRATPTKVDVL